MATDKYPQRNVNYPFSKEALDAVRSRLTPPVTQFSHVAPPSGGKGSRREVRPGEWIDDRVIVIDGPATPSDESRVEPKRETRALPVFSTTKVYSVMLAKPVQQDGQWLSPAISYEMVGAVCIAVSASILDAVEIGDIPFDPDAPPS